MIDLHEGLRLARGFYSTGRGDPVAPDISVAYTAWLDNNAEAMIQELLSLREDVARLRGMKDHWERMVSLRDIEIASVMEWRDQLQEALEAYEPSHPLIHGGPQD